ncbi:hypothetical protein [Streptacidiphilus jiangxiensis]|uniref:hypothetical protein n=1 Tax=Streptacidiphilus jiangxiensis TaxID=235985 RepID=UPI0005A87DE5|nr:hypothetical protein [Streptacidiphilus jiangxiensis]
MDLLTILVRESAQNSWDARLADPSGPVDFRLALSTVSPAHAPAWRDLLIETAPVGRDSFPLRDVLRQGAVRLLTISDRGTRGLGGPTRADNAVGPERDFVSFIRNIGEPRDTALGGGTYGFGKGIFYLLSRPGTILVHSRCAVPGGRETRLIGCTLWRSYVDTRGPEPRRYTGRHWWGDTTGDVVEPLVGEAAEDIAHRLGLQSFAEHETGTTIVVIDPSLDEMAPREAADYLAETIVWHLWPKMIGQDGQAPAMRFAVACDGVEHPVPNPRELDPIGMFVAAYERMTSSDGSELHCKSPKRFLGRLGLVKRILPGLEPTRASRMVGLETLVHHVALMRPAELVVSYHPGPKPPSENQGYAGVFRADVTMDDVYARAEPPTHDAWHPQSLERPESTFVQTTFRRIGEAVDGLFALSGVSRGGSAGIALGAASRMLSGLVGGAWGVGGAIAVEKPGSTAVPKRGVVVRESEEGSETTGAAAGGNLHMLQTGDHSSASWAQVGAEAESGDYLLAPPGGHNGTEAPQRRPRVRLVGDPYYDTRGNTDVLVQDFRLPVPGRQRVSIDLAVTLPGGGARETDPPAGAAMPTLLGWENDAGTLCTTETCDMDGGEAVWRALVRPAPDTMTEIDIRVQAVRNP